jgi:raffinose/stachyose/melibiose transport system permease protein
LRNYATVLRDPSLSSSLYFTVLYAVATTVIVTILAIPLAVALNRRFFGRNFARAVFFFPAIPSVAILGFVWAFILSPLSSGALNALLKFVGAGPVPWLSDFQLAQASVIIVGVWTLTGWHAILYLAYLQSIPDDFYEAATIDGAGNLQQFWYLTVPMLRPAIAVSTLLLLVSGMNVYALPIALTGGGPGFSTFTITQSIITQGLAQGQYGQAAALSIIFMAIIAVLIGLQMYLGSRRRGDKD